MPDITWSSPLVYFQYLDNAEKLDYSAKICVGVIQNAEQFNTASSK